MKSTRAVLASLAALTIVLGACSEGWNPLDPTDSRTEGAAGGSDASGNPSHSEADPLETALIAGRTMEVGVVRVWNDESTLFIQYELSESGTCLLETHLHAAESLEGIPQTRTGNPIPGRFDHKMRHDCAGEFTREIELAWEPGTELFIAAHADVSNGEGAWGAGTGFPGRNWAMYFNFVVAEADDDGGEDGEGGFAARYRSFGNTAEPEIYLGAFDLEPDERAERDLGSTAWGDENALTFAYDAGDDLLSTTVEIGSETFALEYASAAAQVESLTGCALADMSRLVFTLAAGDAESNVVLRDATIDGVLLGDLSGAGGPNVLEASISDLGVTLTDGFTLTGTLVLTGDFGADPDLSFVEVATLCPSS